MSINEYIAHSQSVLLMPSVCISFLLKVGFWVSVLASSGSSIRGTLFDLYLSIFLARVNGAVNEGTLRDAYKKKKKCGM